MVLYQQVATRRCDLLVPRSTQDSRTVSLIMTCAFDEVAAPHAHFHSSCYKFVGLAATLRKIDKLQATLGTLEAQNQALEAKLDRVLGAVAV